MIIPHCDSDSVYWAYYQWAEEQLSRWEFEQDLAELEEEEEEEEEPDWLTDPNNVMSRYHY